MRGLTVMVTAPAGLRTGLELAAASAALGARARMFCHGPAVAALYPPVAAPDDWLYVDAGLPSLATLVEEALALGVAILLCQTGLHLTGATATTFDARFDWGGPVSVLETLGDDRLVIA
jgi:predicted peroxiredoxin